MGALRDRCIGIEKNTVGECSCYFGRNEREVARLFTIDKKCIVCSRLDDAVHVYRRAYVTRSECKVRLSLLGRKRVTGYTPLNCKVAVCASPACGSLMLGTNVASCHVWLYARDAFGLAAQDAHPFP